MQLRAMRRFGLAIGLLLAACAPADDPGQTADEEEAASAETQEQPAAQALPAPETEAVWEYLRVSEYTAWPMWPGKSAFYEGTEPHGMLLTTYVNQTALDALDGGATTLPSGAIIVKENFAPDSTHAATTVMYKSEGFDPEHNDWWWLKRNADGTIAAEGMAQGCIACHGGRADNDYIMTSDLGSG